MADRLEQVHGTESLRKYFNSPYMGVYSIDDGAEPVLTIAKVMFGKITLEGGRKEERVLLHFTEGKVAGLAEVKPLVLNATNQKTLEKLYGKGADALIGKAVKLYIDPAVRAVGGGTTEGVRIRSYVPERVVLPCCSDCGGEIKAAMGKGVDYLARYTRQHYGAPLCADCATVRKEAAKAQEDADNAKEGAQDETHE